MLSIFPALFDYAFYGILFLRCTAGFFYILFGMRLLSVISVIREERHLIIFLGFIFGIANLLAGISITMGLYLQIGALLGATLSAATLLQGIGVKKSVSVQQVQILLLVISLSLLFLGPGTFSVDLPL